LLPLLQSAAKLDIHYVDKNQPPYGDHRFYAGLFLLYGFCAAIPSLATAVVSSRFRKLSISVVALCLLLASVCEIVVTFAPNHGSHSDSWVCKAVTLRTRALTQALHMCQMANAVRRPADSFDDARPDAMIAGRRSMTGAWV